MIRMPKLCEFVTKWKLSVHRENPRSFAKIVNVLNFLENKTAPYRVLVLTNSRWVIFRRFWISLPQLISLKFPCSSIELQFPSVAKSFKVPFKIMVLNFTVKAWIRMWLRLKYWWRVRVLYKKWPAYFWANQRPSFRQSFSWVNPISKWMSGREICIRHFDFLWRFSFKTLWLCVLICHLSEYFRAFEFLLLWKRYKSRNEESV